MQPGLSPYAKKAGMVWIADGSPCSKGVEDGTTPLGIAGPVQMQVAGSQAGGVKRQTFLLGARFAEISPKGLLIQLVDHPALDHASLR